MSCALQLVAIDGVDHGPGVAQADSLADTISAANPTRVDQPDVRVVLRDFFRQQRGVLARMPDQERTAETRRERRFWFRHAHLRTRDFRGVTTDEVVFRLGPGESTDGRQDPKGVTRQKDHIPRVSGDARDLSVFDVFDRISASCILRDARVVKVDMPVSLVVNHVLQHGTKTQRIKDLRFRLARQIHRLGVTTSFDVEHPIVGPAVFVVADQQAMWVGRKGGLAGARETEQDRGAMGLSIGGRRAMHREDVFLGHAVIHIGEHRLLHFAGVLRAQDHDFARLEVQVDAGLGGHAGGEAIGRKTAGVVQHQVGRAKKG